MDIKLFKPNTRLVELHLEEFEALRLIATLDLVRGSAALDELKSVLMTGFDVEEPDPNQVFKEHFSPGEVFNFSDTDEEAQQLSLARAETAATEIGERQADIAESEEAAAEAELEREIQDETDPNATDDADGDQ
jgi:hypothetical protein